ncbi:signal recognition particle-docking protein FtsY [Tranquillimonas alkanivorans]|uniref:Signal recognition particle receptor FtsY n=1 Tax=Tranquillimonas alkanivorans TaxID=441119 RepID=A0A1I5KL03_9RHOB|nr:signal recognition particle-docking protein FtsY [Tranquillimonas alkanivorans]SFO85567.1 signal recognition particle-docking protein FtsY [Tranquillimonas alkanivorans]
MSFFKKLRDRLTKSSSKLEEGLDAIVEEGGEAEPAAEPEPERSEPERPEPAPAPEPTPEPEPEPMPEPAAEPKPAPPPAPDPFPAPQDPQPALRPEEVPPPAAPAERPSTPPREVPPTPETPATPPEGPETPERPGLFGRLLGRGAPQAPVIRRTLDDDMLEQLEELLISADMGVDTALRVTANMAEGRFGKKLSTQEIKQLLADEVTRIMEPVAKPMPLYPNRPQVVLVVGVNGSGKTTTIGKLASQFRAAGKSVVIAACDTFRAAAVEQLQVWGDRAGVPVLTAQQGTDPASLAFDAMTKAEAEGADLLMIDTAGRLQNRQDLMEELAKIVRVIRKKDPSAPHNTLLVLDATTGQNAVNQVEIFEKLADVSGLVMTKLDGTAKGGVLVALADKFGLPIHAIGVGEQIDDLAPFDPEDFARALTGLDA